MNAQALEALRTGDKTRIAMADLKKSLRDGSADPVDVVQVCDLPIRVFDVLKSLPDVGPSKARQAMRTLGLDNFHTLGGNPRGDRRPLTPEQRIKLAEHIAWRVTGAARWKLAA